MTSCLVFTKAGHWMNDMVMSVEDTVQFSQLLRGDLSLLSSEPFKGNEQVQLM